AARVTHVLTDLLADVRPPVERDDARIVHHLVTDHDLSGGLEDAVAVAVDDRQHRPYDAARDAAVVQREVLRTPERSFAETAAIARRRALLRVRRQRRPSSVGGFGDQ